MTLLHETPANLRALISELPASKHSAILDHMRDLVQKVRFTWRFKYSLTVAICYANAKDFFLLLLKVFRLYVLFLAETALILLLNMIIVLIINIFMSILLCLKDS